VCPTFTHPFLKFQPLQVITTLAAGLPFSLPFLPWLPLCWASRSWLGGANCRRGIRCPGSIGLPLSSAWTICLYGVSRAVMCARCYRKQGITAALIREALNVPGGIPECPHSKPIHSMGIWHPVPHSRALLRRS